MALQLVIEIEWTIGQWGNENVKRKLQNLRLTFVETAVGVVRKANRCLAHETAHQRRKRIVTGHTELMLNVNHRLRRLHNNILIVIT